MKSTEQIAEIIHNFPLAAAIEASINSALQCPAVHLAEHRTAWDLFERSLATAIRDIENHPRGVLFRRLIAFGPLYLDSPAGTLVDGTTTLSDAECGSAVEFIFSHMVNRFKGELAELLALAPCITLMERLEQAGRLPDGAQLYWGELVQEKRRIRRTSGKPRLGWSNFTKGADGLMAQSITKTDRSSQELLGIYGIIEIKSMLRSSTKMLEQIDRHISRLMGGIRLGSQEWGPEHLIHAPTHKRRKDSGLIRVMITPSNWNLSREWRSVKNETGRVIVLPEPTDPPLTTCIDELEPSIWRIILAWSEEALEQAAYEMTFWYMSQVGAHIYADKPLPKGWEEMSPEEAGYNSIKMMLYHILLRCVTKRQETLATKLYNVYSFGYSLGIDSKEMLWPKNFPHTE